MIHFFKKMFEEKPKEKNAISLEKKPEFDNGIDNINEIVEKGINDMKIEKVGPENYIIKFYDLEFKSYTNLRYGSKEVLGVDRIEFRKICVEMFNAICGDLNSDYSDLYYKDIKHAKKAMEDFKSYYQSYYVPKIIIKRLSNYDEENGGYPCYFRQHQDINESSSYEK